MDLSPIQLHDQLGDKVVNHKNYYLVREHLKYLEEVYQLSPDSIRRYWFCLRHLLIWADEASLCYCPELYQHFAGGNQMGAHFGVLRMMDAQIVNIIGSTTLGKYWHPDV